MYFQFAMYENTFKQCMKMSALLATMDILYFFIILIGEK